MKSQFVFLSLLSMGSVFSSTIQHHEMLTKEGNASLFQSYLATCSTRNIRNQPIYLRHPTYEKAFLFTDITILNLEVPSLASAYTPSTSILPKRAELKAPAIKTLPEPCVLIQYTAFG